MFRPNGPRNDVANRRDFDQSGAVPYLTKQQQWVLCVVIGLLLIGWAVKAWRTAHPPVQSVSGPTH
jgi:hypothetical protein